MTVTISVHELSQLCRSGQKPEIVDVRSETDFGAAHIPGAKCIPLQQLPFRHADLHDGDLVLVCEAGMRARIAEKNLKQRSGTIAVFALPLDQQENLRILSGIAAVLGHNFTCWLKFKGGKGIATTGGVYLALAPWAVLIGLAAFILAVLATRYVSIGSIVAAVALPAAVWILPPHNLLLGIVTTALGVMAIYKHRGNIQRLMAGTESRLGKKTTTEVPR